MEYVSLRWRRFLRQNTRKYQEKHILLGSTKVWTKQRKLYIRVLKIISSPNIRRNGKQFWKHLQSVIHLSPFHRYYVCDCFQETRWSGDMPSHVLRKTDCKILPCLSDNFKIDHFPYLVYHGFSHFFAVITIAVFISSNFSVSTRTL